MKERNPLDLDAQRAQDAESAEALRMAREQEIADLKTVMSTPDGRRFIWALLGVAGIYRTSFTGNSETFYREGARNVGLRYLALIEENCPELYLLMYGEATAGKKERNG